MKFISKLILSVAISVLFLLPVGTAAYARAAESRYGDITKISRDIYVNEGDTVDGDVVTLNGNIYVNGSVTGSAIAIFGDIIVNGEILDDAVTVTGEITVGQNGRVLGDTVEALSGTFRDRRSNDIIESYTYRIPNINIEPINRSVNVVLSFFGAVTLFLLAFIVYVIMPRRVDEMVDTIEPNLGKRIGLGALTVIGFPVVIVIVSIVLAITIIGILVIPFAWIAFLIFILVSLVPAYVFIGKRTIALFGSKQSSGYAGLAAGIFVIWLINTILSFGGGYTGWMKALISFFVSVLGAGSIVDYLITIRKMKKAHDGGFSAQEGRYNNGYNQGPDVIPSRSIDANNEDSPENGDNR